MEHHQRAPLHLQRRILILNLSIHHLLSSTHAPSPDRHLKVHEPRPTILTSDQPLPQRLRQMRPGRNAETSILERGVFERIPERQTAGRVGEADLSVLMWIDPVAASRELGDDLALRDARVGVTQGLCDGAMEGGPRQTAE